MDARHADERLSRAWTLGGHLRFKQGRIEVPSRQAAPADRFVRVRHNGVFIKRIDPKTRQATNDAQVFRVEGQSMIPVSGVDGETPIMDVERVFF